MRRVNDKLCAHRLAWFRFELGFHPLLPDHTPPFRCFATSAVRAPTETQRATREPVAAVVPVGQIRAPLAAVRAEVYPLPWWERVFDDPPPVVSVSFPKENSDGGSACGVAELVSFAGVHAIFLVPEPMP